MSYTTVEAEIHHGQVTVKEPEKLPAQGRGLLIVLPPAQSAAEPERHRVRARLPIIQGDGQTLINPSPEELDASLWD
jgi:hypothetical protein